MRRLWAHLAAVLIFFGSPALALDLGLAHEDGGRAGAFLNFAPSARSLGMGRAHTALADDASASYWNPAGLSQLERSDIVVLYSPMAIDSSYGFFSYAQPAANYGTFSVGVVSLQSGNFDKRLGPGISDMAGSFEVNQTAVLLSHGIKFRSRWALGETVKVIREEVDTSAGTGVGLDPGVLYSINSKWKAGATIKNLMAPKLKLKSSTDVYPRELRLGVKWQPQDRIIVASDLSKMENAQPKLSVGTEWRPGDLLALRCGFNESELTVGFGFQLNNWSLDYAFGYNAATPEGTESFGDSHRFGIRLSFGPNVMAEERALLYQKKGQEVLAALRTRMGQEAASSPQEIENLVAEAKEVVSRRGYPEPRDLYLVQGYINYFERKYDKSTYYFAEAISLLQDKDEDLEGQYRRAQEMMTEEMSAVLISAELKRAKEAFDKGDYKITVESCQKILKIDPVNVEALTYLENADKRINEPILLGIKIAKAKMEQGLYLDAVRSLAEVQKKHPQNTVVDELMEQAMRALEEQGVAGVRFVQEITPDQNKSREFYSQGLLLYSKGDLRGAANAWAAALQHNGQNQAARNAYNRVLIELKSLQ